jgi:hypothetical protein
MKHLRLLVVTSFAVASFLFQPVLAQNSSPYWSLAGNNNATASQKLGTTNNISLRIVTNNTDRIKILNSGNVGIGVSTPAQKLDVAGNINLAKGYGLYMENRRILRVDSSRTSVFLGNGAGANNNGIENTATGYYALYSNVSAYKNTATGAFALYSTTSGGGNVATGFKALYLNSTGFGNTATGNSALYRNSEGHENAALGGQALELNTIGSYNTAAGKATLYSNNTGNYNTALGYYALGGNVTGNENIAIGSQALDATQDASSNTAVGHLAGHYFQNGWNNTFVGSYARAGVHGIFNSVALGNGTTVYASNQVRIGNSYTTSIGGYSSWTNISDRRVKKNILENVPGLAFINKLRPVTYNLDLDATDKIMGAPAGKDKDGKTLAKQPTQAEIGARQAKQQVVYTGFIAQDVEKAAKELNYNFSGVDAAKNEKDLYGLRYTEFVMPLVKAVQELSKQNDAAKEENKQLKEQLGMQQRQLDDLRQIVLGQKGKTASPTALKTSLLIQNAPNPAKTSTRIAYQLPEGLSPAQLLLTDGAGKILRNLSLTTSGTIDLNVGTLRNGMYNYSLVVAGTVLETKRLTVAR